MADDREIRQELLAAMRGIIRESVMTLHALPDSDARYRGWAQMPTMFVREASEAYGWSSPKVRLWKPSPRHVEQMPVAMAWLAWLRRTEGQLALRRIWAWALGVALWRIAQREGGCSDATVLNRIDRSVVRIIREFTGTEIPVEHIEEPYQGVSYALIFQPTNPTSAGEIQFMRIYIGGKGMWKRGRYLRDGTHKIERVEKILDHMLI